MSAIFNYEAHARMIEEFVERAPRLLESSPYTADLAGKVARLMESSESPFTLAVIGQMRVGKSTLLNSLVGEDLAITGVNETTATINWFKFGEGKLLNRFRVNWKDRPAEELPREAITDWIGDSSRAAATAFLEFFSDAEFLKKIYVVDTPGTRSVMESHEETLQDFLAEKREQETLRHGGAADAVLYVFPPVARETDENLLQTFEERTRLPGSSPYNSVAVVHKWETLNVEDPYADALLKAARIAEHLQKHVSAVIPVSGPLGMAAARLTDDFWEEISRFGRESNPEVLQRLLTRGEERFKRREVAGSLLPPAARARLLGASKLPWPCFRMLLRLARREEATDGTALRQLTAEVAGLRGLVQFLEERFFSRTRLIKSFSLLAKALEPCATAQLRLRNKAQELERKQARGEKALHALAAADPVAVEAAQAFIEDAVRDVRTLAAAVEQLERELANQVRAVRESFEELDRDVRCLRLLDDGKVQLSEGEAREVRTVLGCFGSSLHERYAAYEGDGASLLEAVEERLDYWNGRAVTSRGPLQGVSEHMVSRLNEIADALEKPGGAA